MGMGRKRDRQGELFMATADLARSPGHPFYVRLNKLLNEAEFDRWLEAKCAPHFAAADKPGRPSIPPGTYFRMLLIGYFEGLESQRGIAWRCADSLSLHEFLGVAPHEPTPDHSTLTNTRKRLPPEIFDDVFRFVLQLAGKKKLISGKRVGVDTTTVEADAAMKSIVRRDTGEDWREYVTRLMKEEGVISPDAEPTNEELRRFDKKRKKKASNAEWGSTTDPDAEITQLKDGRTHLAYKSSHVVDLESDLILAAPIHKATTADMHLLVDDVLAAQENLQAAQLDVAIAEVAADKGYHSAAALELCDELGLRTYIPEPKMPQGRVWTEKPPAQQRVVYANRRRMKRAKGKRLGRLRSERVERSFAHVCDAGGMRRSRLRGLIDVTKRYLIAAAAHNLGRILFKLFGIGKPRSLQGNFAAENARRALALLSQLLTRLLRALSARVNRLTRSYATLRAETEFPRPRCRMSTFSTGC
jgi:transposase